MSEEVFINYRTGDGDEAAALIGNELSGRFGHDMIFRASSSIPPGAPYPERLREAARSSSALLAVIGPAWSRNPLLHNEEDWVRREIAIALAAGKVVIPVIKGRTTERLNPADLPGELRSLADRQSLRLDTRDSGADLQRIGDWLARLVPALRAADQQASQHRTASEVRNSARDVHGTAVQARDIAGDAGTVIKGAHGPVHTGRGHIYQDSQFFTGDRAAYVRGDNHGGINPQLHDPREDGR